MSPSTAPRENTPAQPGPARAFRARPLDAGSAPNPSLYEGSRHGTSPLTVSAPSAGWCIPQITRALKTGALDNIALAPTGPPGYLAEYVVHAQAASEARRRIVEALSGWGSEELVGTAELLVSELVTNVITHTSSPKVGVAVTLVNQAAVRVTVLDTDQTEISMPTLPRDDEERGRGLVLVAALAARWGIEYVGTGKQIWFELDVTARVVTL
ncbi:ATP-binding protein [Streptomyces sp. NPDC048717]|uniref:ATP-binding protein n=1 Tax=Streptomyces sp. NPDC048717 TaxID=3154928 RepID=UPI003436AB2A